MKDGVLFRVGESAVNLQHLLVAMFEYDLEAGAKD